MPGGVRVIFCARAFDQLHPPRTTNVDLVRRESANDASNQVMTSGYKSTCHTKAYKQVLAPARRSTCSVRTSPPVHVAVSKFSSYDQLLLVVGRVKVRWRLVSVFGSIHIRQRGAGGWRKYIIYVTCAAFCGCQWVLDTIGVGTSQAGVHLRARWFSTIINGLTLLA